MTKSDTVSRVAPVVVWGANDWARSALCNRLADQGAVDVGVDVTSVDGASVAVLLPAPPNPHMGAGSLQLHLIRHVILAERLRDTGVGRAVLLSRVGADPASSNPYLRDLGRIEAAVLNSGIESLVVRVTHTFGSPANPGPFVTSLLAQTPTSVTIDGPGTQLVQPIYSGDVIEILAAAARHGDDVHLRAAVVEIGGPEVMPLAIFADRLNGGAVKVGLVPMRHRPRRLERWLPWLRHGVSRAFVEIMAADSLADHHTDIASRWGVRLHRVEDVWPSSGSMRRAD